jgi:hypothetical protein
MRKRISMLVLAFGVGLPTFGAQPDARSEDFEVRTLSPLSASGNKKGDKFTVEVLAPERFQKALIEGEVVTSKASGKIKGRSELLFRFSRLILADGTELPLQKVELKEIKNSQGVASVDEEGRTLAKPSKREILWALIFAGAGAAIGGATAGQQGAVAGAALGLATAVAVAFSTRGPDIRLEPGSIFVLRVTEKERKPERL